MVGKLLEKKGIPVTMKYEKISGKNKKHHVKIFTLSTCGWCRKTKDFLKSLDVEYEYIDVDLLPSDEWQEVNNEVKKYNPLCTFPTIVIDEGKKVIVGFKDADIKGALR